MRTKTFTSAEIADKMLVFQQLVANGDKTQTQYQNFIDSLYYVFGYYFMYEATDKAKQIKQTLSK